MPDSILFSRLAQLFLRLDYGLTKGSVYKWLLRRLPKTPVLSCNPEARVQLHSLTSHEDLPKYVIAVKSFLRFYPNIAVFVHSDGTLTPKDGEFLSREIQGIKVLPPVPLQEIEREMGPVFAKFLAHYPIWRKVIDILVPFHNQKIILMDSDVLFMRKPDELISWIEQENVPPMYMLESPADFMGDLFKEKGVSGNKELPLIKSFNSGLLCFVADVGIEETKEVFEMVLENFLLDYDDPKGPLFDQTIYSVILGRRNARPLPLHYYNVVYSSRRRPTGAKMLHFTSYSRLSNFTFLVMRRSVIRELRDLKCARS